MIEPKEGLTTVTFGHCNKYSSNQIVPVFLCPAASILSREMTARQLSGDYAEQDSVAMDMDVELGQSSSGGPATGEKFALLGDLI